MQNGHSLPRGCAAKEGVSPKAIIRMIQRWEAENSGVHSVMVLRHGNVIAEGWKKPYQPQYEHMLNSMSKSFTSTAIGFAVQEGLLTTETYLLDIFPEYRSLQIDPRMEKLQIKHLLTMSTGHAVNADFIFNYEDPVRAFLTSELAEDPGNHFRYNTGATYMLSAAITKLTGESVFDYLRPRLFEPLGMMENIWWEQCGRGNSVGGYGLNVKTEDLAKFGQFLLNRGVWNGKQLLNAEWIDTATRKHISNNAATQTPWLDTDVEEEECPEITDWNRGYGYQFWRCIPEGVYRGDGAFGQYTVVFPAQEMVIAITSGSVNMAGILTIIWEELLPGLQEEPLENAEDAQNELNAVLEGWEFQPIENKAAPAFVGVKEYQIARNALGIQKIRIESCADGADTVTVCWNGRTDAFLVGKGEWLNSELGFERQPDWPFRLQIDPQLSVSGAWTAENEYTLTLINNRRAYHQTAVCTLNGERITISVTQNFSCPQPVILNGTTI